MTWILCCGALWIALVVTICLFFHGATSSAFGEQGGVANDNGIARASDYCEKGGRRSGARNVVPIRA
jgi:hypothetical protein